MAMDKINGAPILRQGALESSRHSDGLDAAKKKAAEAAEDALGGPAANFGDTAQISDAAHRMMDLRRAVDVGRAAFSALPAMREEKLAQARERLKSGFYDSNEVREKIAANVDRVFQGLEEL